MTASIHPSSVIDPAAKIGKNVQIGPFCVVGPQVTLADNVILRSHVVVDGITTIGEGTEIFPFASIGAPTPDLKYHGEPSELHIGKNNKIREYVTMNPGTESGGMITTVGDNCLFMPSSHVAHDCRVGNNVIMANSAALGGHVHIGNFVVIGGLSGIHQFVRVGDHAIIGGMSAVESDVIPFGRVKGERAFLAGLNLIGLERRGFTKDHVKNLQRAFNQLFGEEGTMEQRLDMVASDFANDELVMNMLEFARAKTKFPLCQPPKKAA